MSDKFISAIRDCEVEEVEKLIRDGIDVNKLDQLGRTPLMCATAGQSKELIQILLRAGANINIVSTEGLCALKYAIARGNPEIVEMLIRAGADVNMMDERGVTILAYAKSYCIPFQHHATNEFKTRDDEKIIDILIRAGAKDADKEESKQDPSKSARPRP